jgi:hypothetical protein
MSNQTVHRMSCTAKDATTVTLEQVATLENQPGDLPIASAVLTIGATPAAYFWAVGQQYLIRVDRAG